MFTSQIHGGAAAILLVALLLPNLNAAEPASVLLQKAIYAEETEGDLKTAIELYRKVRGEDKFLRSVAAQAQFRLAVCLQKQGNKKEAIAAFRELISQFPAQQQLVIHARKELASLGAAASDLKIRKVMIQGEPAYEGVHETRLGRVSPDGRYFSFSDWRSEWGYIAWLRVRDLKTGVINDVVDPHKGGRGVWNSIWSPDGKWIAYHCGTNGGLAAGLRISRPDGSEARTVLKTDPGLFDWSRDGKYILGYLRTNMVLITVADGTQRTVKSFKHSLWGADFLQEGARFSPDGRYIAYAWAPDENDPFQRDIFVLATDGSGEWPLVEHPSHDYEPVWTPDGKAIVFASNRTGAMGLWLVPVANGKAQGSPQLIVQTMGRIHPKDFTKDGLFYYDVHLGDSDLFVAELDPQTGKATSEPTRLSVPYEGWVSAPSWSPDGEQIAFIARPNFTRGALDDYTRTLLCIHSTRTGQTRELATPPELKISAQAQWSSDGKQLLVEAQNVVTKTNGLYRIDARTGEATVVRKAESGHLRLNQQWDGTNYTNTVIMWDEKSGQEREVWRTKGWIRKTALSPDGNELAILEMEPVQGWEDPSRQAVLRIVPMRDGERREVVRFPKGQRPMSTLSWTPDGKHILFAKGRHGAGLVYYRVDAKGGTLQELGIVNGINEAVFSLHPNGRKLVFQGTGRLSELWAIEGLDVPEAVLPQQAKKEPTSRMADSASVR